MARSATQEYYVDSLVDGSSTDEKSKVRESVAQFLVNYRPPSRVKYLGLPGPHWLFEKNHLLDKLFRLPEIVGAEKDKKLLPLVERNAPGGARVLRGDLFAEDALEEARDFDMAWLDSCSTIHDKMLGALAHLGDYADPKVPRVPVALTIMPQREAKWYGETWDLLEAFKWDRTALVSWALDQSKTRHFEFVKQTRYNSHHHAMLTIMGLLTKRSPCPN